MALRGEFGDTGLEMRPEPLLKKSPTDVGKMLEEFVKAADGLEKRSRDLDTDQLYELQQQLGLIVGQVQKDIYGNLAKSSAKKS
jgi:hypothetical protein